MDVICIWKNVLVWLVVISLLTSQDKIDVCVELLADYVWESGDDKKGFFSVGVDIFDQLFLKNDQFTCQ